MVVRRLGLALALLRVLVRRLAGLARLHDLRVVDVEVVLCEGDRGRGGERNF